MTFASMLQSLDRLPALVGAFAVRSVVMVIVVVMVIMWLWLWCLSSWYEDADGVQRYMVVDPAGRWWRVVSPSTLCFSDSEGNVLTPTLVLHTGATSSSDGHVDGGDDDAEDGTFDDGDDEEDDDRTSSDRGRREGGRSRGSGRRRSTSGGNRQGRSVSRPPTAASE
jgi:hypothetical protein